MITGSKIEHESKRTRQHSLKGINTHASESSKYSIFRGGEMLGEQPSMKPAK